MRTTTWMPRAAAVLCAGVLLTGCSSTDAEPTAKSGGDATTPAVDLAALDTGSYPTSLAPEFARATKDNIVEVDGQRLAEFTVVPFEIDPELTMAKMPTMVMRSGANLGVVISNPAGEIAKNHNMLYGYVTTAATNTPKITDPSRSVVHAVMRFKTPEDAAAAARDIHTEVTTVDDGAGIHKAETIDVLPNTLVSTRETSFQAGAEVSVNALTPHGDYLIYTYAKAPAAQKDWTAQAVAKALSLQGPLIDKFPATPTKEQNGGKPAELPMVDQDKILIYAIPEADAQAKLGDDLAVYGPRGMSHRSTNPPLTYRVLSETGAEHNAVAKTAVYRAKDDAGAQRIVEEFTNDLTSQGYTPAPAPQGLSNATCVTKDTTNGTSDYCMVVKGRYVGEANGLDNKKDVDQQISAQYLILDKADQNA
ncbi:DUF7373 family lipoprotein [Prescottella agglutinans]|uniref:Uncharacterized protein n=1 Tax=Prescottella agglutinans TaxID=1644129 RepID=A0ABT6MK11_9NOCA|nr:hypothetical protein [Prescottella agglutinans]MDH6284658.1 hypothetical protein [Prescottella agglutinans]